MDLQYLESYQNMVARSTPLSLYHVSHQTDIVLCLRDIFHHYLYRRLVQQRCFQQSFLVAKTEDIHHRELLETLMVLHS